jgi:hypothetical protein
MKVVLDGEKINMPLKIGGTQRGVTKDGHIFAGTLKKTLNALKIRVIDSVAVKHGSGFWTSTLVKYDITSEELTKIIKERKLESWIL